MSGTCFNSTYFRLKHCAILRQTIGCVSICCGYLFQNPIHLSVFDSSVNHISSSPRSLFGLLSSLSDIFVLKTLPTSRSLVILSWCALSTAVLVCRSRIFTSHFGSLSNHYWFSAYSFQIKL